MRSPQLETSQAIYKVTLPPIPTRGANYSLCEAMHRLKELFTRQLCDLTSVVNKKKN